MGFFWIFILSYYYYFFFRQRDIIYYIKKAEKGRAKDTTNADFLANNGNRSTRIQLLYRAYTSAAHRIKSTGNWTKSALFR